MSERKANRDAEQANPSTQKARSSTSLLQTLRPWLALTPASTDATTTCPCPDHNMALYSLFKIPALCALFQAASAAVRRQPPPPYIALRPCTSGLHPLSITASLYYNCVQQ